MERFMPGSLHFGIKPVLDFSCISCRRKTLHRDKALLSISL